MLPWDEPSWLDDITAWTGEQVALVAPVEVLHRRAWSAMLLARTTQGLLYVKATAPASAHEVPLTVLLAERHPQISVEVVAADAERGWLLMRDAGEALRARLGRDPDLAVVESLYARYGALQRDLAGATEELLAQGVPDRRPSRLPDLAARLDAGVDVALIRDLVAALDACPLPDTLAHEEIHDANLVVRDDHLVVIDWADSCVGHPYFGIVVGLRSLSDRLELAPGAPALERLVDAYLEPWTDVAPRSDLRSVLAPAYRLGMLNRALSWDAGAVDLDDAGRAEHRRYVQAWVEEFTAATEPLPGT